MVGKRIVWFQVISQTSKSLSMNVDCPSRILPYHYSIVSGSLAHCLDYSRTPQFRLMMEFYNRAKFATVLSSPVQDFPQAATFFNYSAPIVLSRRRFLHLSAVGSSTITASLIGCSAAPSVASLAPVSADVMSVLMVSAPYVIRGLFVFLKEVAVAVAAGATLAYVQRMIADVDELEKADEEKQRAFIEKRLIAADKLNPYSEQIGGDFTWQKADKIKFPDELDIPEVVHPVYQASFGVQGFQLPQDSNTLERVAMHNRTLDRSSATGTYGIPVAYRSPYSDNFRRHLNRANLKYSNSEEGYLPVDPDKVDYVFPLHMKNPETEKTESYTGFCIKETGQVLYIEDKESRRK
jgi:hypothetical protein